MNKKIKFLTKLLSIEEKAVAYNLKYLENSIRIFGENHSVTQLNRENLNEHQENVEVLKELLNEQKV